MRVVLWRELATPGVAAVQVHGLRLEDTHGQARGLEHGMDGKTTIIDKTEGGQQRRRLLQQNLTAVALLASCRGTALRAARAGMSSWTTAGRSEGK